MVFPAGEISVEEVARKDVPFGVAYLIVDDADIPADFSTSAAWVVDFSVPSGLGLGPHRWHIEQAEARIAAALALTPPEPPSEPELEQPLEPSQEADEEALDAYAAALAAYQAEQATYQVAVAEHAEMIQQLASFQAAVQAENDALIAQMKAEVFDVEGVIL